MAYTLTRADLQETTVLEKIAWSVKLTVTSSDSAVFPPEVLVYHAADPQDAGAGAWFECVASPAQLLEYPEDEPAQNSGGLQQPYFRLDNVQLVARNAVQLEELIAKIFAELDLLSRNIQAINTLMAATTVGTTQ